MGQSPLRIGILGAARIAPGALILPARDVTEVEIVAVAARDVEKAHAFAQAHGVPEVAESYEALITRPDIDAIYNALPPSRHADLTIAALRAGKSVLCEKPFAMDGEEARAMVAAVSEGQVLMEAFHYRYHPLFDRLLTIVRQGEIGAIKHIEAVFQVAIAETDEELRFYPELGGGTLMDMGTYCLHWCRTLMGSEPTVVAAKGKFSDRGVDLETDAQLLFPGGAAADIHCSMIDPVMKASLMIRGETGEIRVLNPLAPQAGHRLDVMVGGIKRTETASLDPTYLFQLQAFAEACRTGIPPLTSGTDSIAQMDLIDAVAAASRKGV